jgi:endonuclease YncB( thermonuclease family)
MAFALRSISCLACVLACLTAGANAASDTGELLHAQVLAYGSATAFAVLDSARSVKRVKLTGVDAPEKKQRFAQQAQRLASEYLGTSAIAIAVDAVDEQRIHGRVTVDGRDLGLILLEAGFAWCDPADASRLPRALQSAYAHACEQARGQRRGLWSDAHPVPPWEYRRIPQFEPLPRERAGQRHCREIGYQALECDDGVRYRVVGGKVVGSDGTSYTRRGNTVTGGDGNRFEVQGSTIYGTDGRICRTRGRHVDCH